MRSICLSESCPAYLAPFWLGAPTLRFVRLVVFSTREGPRNQPETRLPGFDPAPESYPASPHLRAAALSRFFAPTAQPNRQEPPPPGIPPPGSCCVPALPACPDALLPRRSPRYVSTGRAHGVHPSELDLAEIATPLGARPLMRLAPGGASRTMPAKADPRRGSAHLPPLGFGVRVRNGPLTHSPRP